MAYPDIKTATEQLAAAIRQSEEYTAYQQHKDIVMADDTNKALLKEYQRLQTKLQMAAVMHTDSTEDDVQRFKQLSGLLMMNAEISQYMLSQIRVQQLVSEVFQTVTQAADLDLQLPGM